MKHLRYFESSTSMEEISEDDFYSNRKSSNPSILTEKESLDVTKIFNKYDDGTGYIRYFLIPGVDRQEDGYETSNNMDIQCSDGRYCIGQIDIYKMKPKYLNVYFIHFSGSYHPNGDLYFRTTHFDDILSCMDKGLKISKKYWSKQN